MTWVRLTARLKMKYSRAKNNSRMSVEIKLLHKCYGSWYNDLIRLCVSHNTYSGVYAQRKLYLSLTLFGFYIFSLSLIRFSKTNKELREHRFREVYANSIVHKFCLIKPSSIFSINDERKTIYLKTDIGGKNCIRFPEKDKPQLVDMNPEQVITYHPKTKSIKL